VTDASFEDADEAGVMRYDDGEGSASFEDADEAGVMRYDDGEGSRPE